MTVAERARKTLGPKGGHQGHDARDVARYLISRTLERDDPKTGLAHLNLLYFAHVWMLAKHGRPLCRQTFQVTGWGPRIDGAFGSAIGPKGADVLVTTLPEGQQPPGLMFDESERQIVDWLLDTWGQEDGWRLQAAATAPDSPWDQTRMAKGGGVDIPNKFIRKHYQQFVRADTK